MRAIASLCAGALLALGLAFSVGAHEVKANGMVIEHPWARSTPPNAKTGAVYMTIVNEGETPDRLIGAETDVAEKVEIHTHTMEDGIARMRPIEAIEITPGSPTRIEPGALHLMLIGLKEPLEAETAIAMTLIFQHAGRVEIEAFVEADPDPATHDHMGH